MNTRAALTGAAIALAVIVLVVAVWLVLAPRGNRAAGQSRPGVLVEGTNPALDVRYTYDNAMFTPAPYDARAEYPLRLDSAGFSFYGKRIRGVGSMLAKDPGGILYDFVGAEHLESLVQYYKLIPVGEPLYEDAQIGGKLGLHQVAQYDFGSGSMWPYYFQQAFKADPPPATCHVEGWAVFTEQDLFFFQAVSLTPLAPEQRHACQQVMDSLRFNAVLGGAEPEEETGVPAGGSEPQQNSSGEEKIPSAANEQEAAPLPVEGQ